MGDKLDDREMGAPTDVTFQLRGAAADVTGTVEVEEQLCDSSREASDNISWDNHLVIAPNT